MSGQTGISWTDVVWNPVTGCDRVSPGCAHCYALTRAGQLKVNPRMQALGLYQRDGDPRTSGPGFGVTLRPEVLDAPLRWRTPKRVFVNSMSDLFHEAVPDDFIADVFAVMAATPRHTYQVLTKRPERMRERLSRSMFDGRVCGAAVGLGAEWPDWPLPNVHLGVSAENQHWADERVDKLLQTPAAVRFVSVEPMLGPVDLHLRRCGCDRPAYMLFLGQHECPTPARTLDWVICGAESGPKRRPFDLDWARSLRDQCRAAGVPYFFKQGSAFRSGQPCGDPELDGCKDFPS